MQFQVTSVHTCLLYLFGQFKRRKNANPKSIFILILFFSSLSPHIPHLAKGALLGGEMKRILKNIHSSQTTKRPK